MRIRIHNIFSKLRFHIIFCTPIANSSTTADGLSIRIVHCFSFRGNQRQITFSLGLFMAEVTLRIVQKLFPA